MGEVYKLTDGVLNYYGSTKNKALWRFYNHKSSIGCASNQLDQTKLEYEVLEVVEGTGDELRQREQYYIDNYECVNIANAYRSPETKKAQGVIRSKKCLENSGRKLLRYECGCGSNVRLIDKASHFKTKKHITYTLT